jgi:hypothetical protein
MLWSVNVQKTIPNPHPAGVKPYAWTNVYYVDAATPDAVVPVIYELIAAEAPLYPPFVHLQDVGYFPVGTSWTDAYTEVTDVPGTRPAPGGAMPGGWAALLSFDQGAKRPVYKYMRLYPTLDLLDGDLWSATAGALLAEYADAVRAITPLIRSKLGDALGPESWVPWPVYRALRHGTRRRNNIRW